MLSLIRLFALWQLSGLITPSLAQTSKLFQWGFANTALSTSLPTCVTLPIIVKSFDPTTNATQGTPPYYMIAFAVGETPVTTLIGTDENNLSWTITQPVGSTLILSVVDANGSAGGIPPRPFTIIAGSTTQCVNTPIQTPAFTVTANVTGDLQTCQPWGFTVKGGVPPYTITLAQPNSPVVTNVTLPFGDDSFTYINRADPNGQLIGAISDFTGRWATGTPIANTKGSTDVSCVGLVSSSGNATLVQQATDAALDSSLSSAKKRRSVAIGLSVTFILLALIGAGLAGFVYLRRRQQRKDMMSDTRPHQFVEIEAQMPSVRNAGGTFEPLRMGSRGITPREAVAPQQGGAGAEQTSKHARNLTSVSTTTALSYYPSVSGPDEVSGGPAVQPQSQASGGPRGVRPGFSRFPTASIRRSAKSVEASMTTEVSPDSEYPAESAISTEGGVLGRPLSAISEGRGGTVPREAGEEGRMNDESAVTHQHQIGELPPPYADGSGMSHSI